MYMYMGGLNSQPHTSFRITDLGRFGLGHFGLNMSIRHPDGQASRQRDSSSHILKRKRNATLSKTVVSSFSSKHSASDNVIAKYRYLPCIQHQNQTAVTYGWQTATKNVRQPPFLKSQSSKIVPILRKKTF